MNISKLVKKVLLEVDEEKQKPRVLAPEDQRNLLKGVLDNCQKYSPYRDREIKFIKKEKMNPFTDLKNMGLDYGYYFTIPTKGGGGYMIFGVLDPKAPNKALLAYRILEKKSPERVPNGMGSECEQVMELKMLGQGQTPLSDQAMKQFEAFLNTEGAGYASLTEPQAADINLYEKVPYSKLTYRDGTPVFNPVPAGNGYAWVQTGMKYSTQNKPKQIEAMLHNQGFTLNEPEDAESDTYLYSFYVKDIADDWPSLSNQKGALRQNQIIYPEREILYPDKKTCRTIIKKLYECSQGTGQDCGVDLFKNKIRVLTCAQYKDGKIGNGEFLSGALGVKDELNHLLSIAKPRPGGEYGLGKLKHLVGDARYGSVGNVTESLQNKINRILNEKRKKLSY